MSDLDTLFEGLRTEGPPAPFAAAEAVRRRGRQRARRQLAAAAVGVVLATGGAGAGFALAVTGQPPPVPPAATPTGEATVPPGWLLTADDLGPGRWSSDLWDGPEFESEPLWWPRESCLDGPQAPAHEVATATAAFSTGPVTESAGSDWVGQVVTRYERGTAEAAFAELRQAYERCARPDDPLLLAYTIVDSGFAGDESLLVRLEQRSYGEGDVVADDPYVTYLVVVRVDDAVSIVRSYDNDLRAADPELLRALAERVAERLGSGG